MALSKRLTILLSIICLCWASDLRICFQETERSSQCQGPSHTCSGWSSKPAWSSPFRDDTDNRAGGCRYQWRIEANGAIDPNLGYRLCFRETEGSSQCQGTRESCTGWSYFPGWTKYFRDDTDNRGGGCRYAWKIESTRINQIWGTCINPISIVCRVCFKETEGSSQCQGTRESCSGWSGLNLPNPHWTSPFRDDTDNRAGGCSYRWYLDCTARTKTISCPGNRPCSWSWKQELSCERFSCPKGNQGIIRNNFIAKENIPRLIVNRYVSRHYLIFSNRERVSQPKSNKGLCILAWLELSCPSSRMRPFYPSFLYLSCQWWIERKLFLPRGPKTRPKTWYWFLFKENLARELFLCLKTDLYQIRRFMVICTW